MCGLFFCPDAAMGRGTRIRVLETTCARPAQLGVAGQVFQRAGTFSDRPIGTAFWYENSNGLVEIAVNQGRADRDLGLAIGSPIEMVL